MTRALLAVAVLLGACGDDSSTLDDLGSVSFPATGSPCKTIEDCVLGCTADAGAGCAAACQTGASADVLALYQALTSCVEAACNTPGDGGVTPCDDPSSIDCMRCDTNSVFKTADDCAGGPSYCGACATEQAACFQ